MRLRVLLLSGATALISACSTTGAVADAGSECFPTCRAGYLCHLGACVSACNPPCNSGEVCVGLQQCVPDAGSGADAGRPGTGADAGSDGGVDAGVDAGVCVPIAITDSFTANAVKNLTIARGGTVSYGMPMYPDAGRTIELLSIQSTSSQSNLTSEFALSTCPGAFDGVPAECKAWGSVNQSGTQLLATTSAAPVAGTCTLILGTQYYISVRNVLFDRVTPSCTPSVCYMLLQLNSY